MKNSRDIIDGVKAANQRAIGRAISIVEDGARGAEEILNSLDEKAVASALILGITGPPGAGKSTLTDRLIASYRKCGNRVGIIAIDPSSPLSGGAILGDRIRMMDHALDADVVMRSMATRGRLGGLCAAAGAAVRIMASAGCSPIIIETVGVGQSEIDIIRLADITLMVLAPGLGDDIQAMKAGLLEVADLLVVNKADMKGAEVLAMELESLAVRSSRKDSICRVCSTVATESIGIKELMSNITAIDISHRDTGERERRRKSGFELEVLDWAVELVKPRLLNAIRKKNLMLAGDPRLKASEVLAIAGFDRHDDNE